MEKINPFVGLFVAIAALNAGMFVWLRADIAEVRGEIAAVRGEIAGNSERLARLEATVEAVQAEHGERLARIEAGLADLRDGLSVTNERMARVEGTVAGALGRPFPERMARAPDAEDAPGG